MPPTMDNSAIVTPETLLAHWQGHRRLTRRMIDAFPEDKLYQYSIGGMRPFAKLADECIKMVEPVVRGVWCSPTPGPMLSRLRSPGRSVLTRPELSPSWRISPGKPEGFVEPASSLPLAITLIVSFLVSLCPLS